jgi:hypothetical protein
VTRRQAAGRVRSSRAGALVLAVFVTAACAADAVPAPTGPVGTAPTVAVGSAPSSVDASTAPASRAPAASSPVPTATPVVPEPTFRTPDEPIPATGAIVSLVTAEAMTSAGTPTRPGGNFTPGTDSVVAIVRVGGIARPAGADLVIAWSMQGPGDIRTPLFDHRVRVRPGDTAFSTAVSPGLLALGAYRVQATLADDRETADWSVLESDAGSTAAVLAREGLGRLAAAAPSTAPSGSPPEGGPPVGGSSGTVPADPDGAPGPSASGTTPGCHLTIEPTGGVSMTVDSTGCAEGASVVAAGPPEGPLTIVERFEGDVTRFYNHDPCRLGGSDLPEGELRYVARTVRGPHTASASATGRLGADETAPRVFVTSTPAPRVLALPGRTILVSIETVDGNLVGIGESGIKEIIVTRDDTSVIARHEYGTEARPCDKTRLSKTIPIEVAVPAAPADLFTVHIAVRDFSGNVARVAVRWPTKARFLAYLSARGTMNATTGEGRRNDCRSGWEFTVEFDVLAVGPVEAVGEAVATAPPICRPWGIGGETQGDFEVAASGAFDGEAVDLRFTPGVSYRAFDGGLFILFLESPTFHVPLGRQVLFDYDWEDPCGDDTCTAHLEGEVLVRCLDCSRGLEENGEPPGAARGVERGEMR